MAGDPLYDPSREPALDPVDAVVVVHRFLERCAIWAEEREIPRRVERFTAEVRPEEAAEQAARLHAWASWLAFVRAAQRELRAGALDDWFRPGVPSRSEPDGV